MQGTFLLVVLLTIVLMCFGSLAACGGGGGGDDDDTSDDENAIKAVVQEIIEGYLEGAEDSLNQKVFPHISEDYSYAGFDKGALQQDMLKDILDEERLEFGKPTIEQDVKVDGKKATDDATAQADISLPWLEEQVGFDVAGSTSLGWTFELQKEGDGKWRVTAIKTAPSTMLISGAKDGYEDSLPEYSNLALSPTDSVAPEGSVSISGQAALDTDNYFYWGSFSLDWYDFIPNLSSPATEDDSAYFYDFTAAKGSFELDATLPDDGEPQRIKIPRTLNLGDDSVRAGLFIMVLDDEPWEGGEIIAVSFQLWIIPLRPVGNEDLQACDNEPLDEENHSGIWLLDVTVTPMDQLLDLSIQDGLALAWAGFVDHGESQPQSRLFAISGKMTSENEANLSASFEQGCPPGDPREIEYQLSFYGTTGSGTVTVSGCGGGEMSLAFEMEKLSNRCEYIMDSDDILGDDWTFVHPDYGNWPMEITDIDNNCYEVVLNNTINLYMCRGLNIGWGYETAKNGVDYGFAFNDLDSGVAIISDYSTGIYKLGEFSR